MTLILGEWREGKVRPIPGNAPHDRPVSRGYVSSKSICDDSFRTTRFPQLQRTRRGPRRAFFRHGGIYRSDVALKPNPSRDRLPPVGRPRTQVEERVGRTTLFSSSAMSSGRLFLDRVARQQSPSPLHRHEQINMHFSEPKGKGDISTLPGRGHFYFALTAQEFRLTKSIKNDTLSPRGTVCTKVHLGGFGEERVNVTTLSECGHWRVSAMYTLFPELSVATPLGLLSWALVPGKLSPE